MIEIWRDIKDYEGLYQVSNLGRVRSVDRYVRQKHNNFQLKRGKILKPATLTNGYLAVHLSKNGISKTYNVHRLVAETFIPNPHNHPTVDHKNRIRTDNREENLRWAPWILQAKNSSAKDVCSKSVLQYTKDKVFVAEYPSAREASRQTGIQVSHITECCLGKNKSAGGYIWKYKDYSLSNPSQSKSSIGV